MNYLREILAFNDLLQTNELSTGQIALWYALMYINNKCGWIEWFSAPNRTLELYSGLSRSGIEKNRNILKQKGLIDFRSKGTKASEYKMMAISNSLQDSLQDSLQRCTQDSLQNSLQNSGTLNKLNKNKTKQNKNSDIDGARKKVSRHKYGEYKNVLLSDEELDKLQTEFPYDWQKRIERLSEYMESSGRGYKSHLATIRKWARMERESAQASSGTNDRKWCTGNEPSPEEVLGITGG